MSDIEVRGLAHIGIPTSDLKKSITFYRNLGFEILVYKEGLEGNNFVFMECSGVIIGLPQPLDETARASAGTKGDGNIDHFALLVDNLDKTKEILEEKGVPFAIEGISVTEAWRPKSCRCIMVYGPDHVKIEFVEMK
ncbi:VOC family protein [Extibacter muris]|uniref:VOC family protein n=1 Tax=Extibacter muris TaxID=1796622 RepID=UPI001D077BA3|nr:VOC family protein [Extibacter muris]MCB6202588.1 VOC family protein [Extibacter muris]MCQ4663825.1 VOC family protein [Extibacter muris]MCQ4693391.1 VOC family protein [Extibacter muris]